MHPFQRTTGAFKECPVLYKASYKIFLLHLCCIIKDKKETEETLKLAKIYLHSGLEHLDKQSVALELYSIISLLQVC